MLGRLIVGASAVFQVTLIAAVASAGDLVRDRSVESPALGRPLLYNVYLPDGHDAPGAQLPVVYLLHGYNGGRHEWAQGGRIEDTLDSLIGAGEIGPLIAVMPEAGNSWYVDSARFGGPGDYETAIVDDLVPAIDRLHATSGERAIAGNSMGGHGALRLAFNHPEVFGAVAALSPAIWRPGGLRAGFGPDDPAPEQREKWYPRTTGETFDLAVFEAQSPFAAVARLASLDMAPRILLASGDDDYFELHDGTVEMYVSLRAIGLKPELRIGDGGHDWTYWRSTLGDVFRFFDAGFRP